jgi:hypothetical protein
MSAGFEVRTPKGKLIIDDTYMNVALDRKIRVESLPCKRDKVYIGDTDGASYYVQWREFSLDYRSDDLFMGVNTHEALTTFKFVNSYGKISIQIHNGVYKYPYNGKEEIYTPAPDISDLYVYIFKKRPVHHSNFGLQVFNKDGDLTYDSHLKYMKILEYGITECDPPHSRQDIICFSPVFIMGDGKPPPQAACVWQFKQQQEAPHKISLGLILHEGLTTPSYSVSLLPLFIVDADNY